MAGNSATWIARQYQPVIVEQLIESRLMCGRYRLTRKDRLAESFEAALSDDDLDLAPRYNIAPTQPILVIRSNGRARVISSMCWGLVPSWAKDRSGAKINARSETIFEKAVFKESFERRRCLIPADGFYEWKGTGKSRQPFHFGLKDDSLFVFAGIWDRWKPPRGPVVESCAILTTTANELVRDVHERMPVILRAERYQTWLHAATTDCGNLTELLTPFASHQMKRWPVGSAVNDPHNDSRECVAEVAEFRPAQAALFG